MKTFDEVFQDLVTCKDNDSFFANMDSVIPERMANEKYKKFIYTQAQQAILDVMKYVVLPHEDKEPEDLLLAEICSRISTIMDMGVLIGVRMEKADF